LPRRLRLYREVIDDVIKGNIDAVTEKLTANGLLDDIVNIRGTSLIVSNLCFEPEPIDTLMWNPLHYAVYF
jgi:hypothetical protein